MLQLLLPRLTGHRAPHQTMTFPGTQTTKTKMDTKLKTCRLAPYYHDEDPALVVVGARHQSRFPASDAESLV